MKVQHNGVTVVLFRHEHPDKLRYLSPRQLDYRRFLATPQWDELRSECYQKAGMRCSQCHRSGRELNAHHVTYPERWEDTTQEHLRCICKPCHNKEHGLAAEPPKKKQKKAPKPPRPKVDRTPVRLEDVHSLNELMQLRSMRRISREDFVVGRLRFGYVKPPPEPVRVKPRHLTKKERRALKEANGFKPGMYEGITPEQARAQVGVNAPRTQMSGNNQQRFARREAARLKRVIESDERRIRGLPPSNGF